MVLLRKTVCFALTVAMTLVQVQDLGAQAYHTDTGGNGYVESQRMPSIAAGVALALVGLTAIIALAVQNQGGSGHLHDHSH